MFYKMNSITKIPSNLTRNITKNILSNKITNCKYLVVGGGIVGSSTAYHLSQHSDDILLVDQNKLTSGTTWHAAGILGQIRNSKVET